MLQLTLYEDVKGKKNVSLGSGRYVLKGIFESHIIDITSNIDLLTRLNMKTEVEITLELKQNNVAQARFTLYIGR